MRKKHLLASLAIFTIAFALRRYHFSGFVLGDDGQEYAVVTYILGHGAPLLTDQLHLRFGWWVPHYLSFLLFGVSETTFMLAQWVTSSMLGVVAYAILFSLGYGVGEALLGGFFVCSAPFEVLIGTTHANDLYLSWAAAVGLLLLFRFEDRPVLQGVSLALCLWYAFYTKLWALYALPVLACYYLVGRRRRGLWAFVAASVLVHGLTCVYWKVRLGTFIPFVETHAANWAVPRSQLAWVFRQYPKMIFKGTELGTTLFGTVPYLAIALVVLKALVSLWPRRLGSSLRLDRVDTMLVAFYGSLFLLLNFFPNGFRLDQYYSVPRIFRYLTPISFPMTLHVAKMVIDLSRVPGNRRSWLAVLFVPLLAINLYQTDEAMRPGRIYRAAFMAAVRDIQKYRPPRLVADALIASWAKDLYLDPRNGTEVVVLRQIYKPEEYEKWIREHEDMLPDGTMLITGLANYPYYGAYGDGPLLNAFSVPLDSRWVLVGEYGLLTYLYRPEPARLWRLKRATSAGVPPPNQESGIEGPGSYEALFTGGMQCMYRNDDAGARRFFRRIIQDYPDRDEQARFYTAMSFFREPDCKESIKAFKQFLRRHPQSPLASAAHLHMAPCERTLGNVARAQARLCYVMSHFSQNPSDVEYARVELRAITFRNQGIVLRLWKRVLSLVTVGVYPEASVCGRARQRGFGGREDWISKPGILKNPLSGAAFLLSAVCPCRGRSMKAGEIVASRTHFGDP